MAKSIEYFQEDDIHIIEIASPPKNLTDQRFFEQMAEVVPQLYASTECSGVIIRGRGRHFSSGADIGELVEVLGGEDMLTVEASSFRSLGIFEGLARLAAPVVATIQGCCLGSGFELALACHYRIAAKSAIFGMPEAGYGLMPGCGGTYRLPQRVGRAKSIEMILSAENILADEALARNIIDLVVDKEKLEETAKKIIRHSGTDIP